MRLLLAANYVTGTDIFVDDPDDDVGFGHLQIVYDPGSGADLQEIEVQSQVPFANFGQWDVRPVQDHVQRTEYYGQDNFYSSIDLSYILEDHNPEDVWNVLLQAHQQFRDASDDVRFQYDADYNSNSFVNTLLSIVGVTSSDPQFRLLTQAMDSFPGGSRNALNDPVYPNDAIDLELTGSDRVDTIHTGNGRDLLDGGDGDDTLGDGGRINQEDGSVENLTDPQTTVDILIGGEGNDVYKLTDDLEKDIILVGSGYDTIEGGNALDRIILPASLLHHSRTCRTA